MKKFQKDLIRTAVDFLQIVYINFLRIGI